MAIAVKCRCGKKFKVKDHLAGRAVRCPACQGPLRIPGEKRKSKIESPKGLSSAPAITREETAKALLKIEEVHQQRQQNAEEEAAAVDERNKLIAAYDQLSGKKQNPKKKNGLAPEKPRKTGVFAKLADLAAAIAGMLIFKYLCLAALLAGGTVCSVYLVKFVSGYVAQEIGPSKPKDEQIKDLFIKAEEAANAKKWGEANRCLMEIIQLEPMREKNSKWQALKARVDKGE